MTSHDCIRHPLNTDACWCVCVFAVGSHISWLNFIERKATSENSRKGITFARHHHHTTGNEPQPASIKMNVSIGYIFFFFFFRVQIVPLEFGDLLSRKNNYQTQLPLCSKMEKISARVSLCLYRRQARTHRDQMMVIKTKKNRQIFSWKKTVVNFTTQTHWPKWMSCNDNDMTIFYWKFA